MTEPKNKSILLIDDDEALSGALAEKLSGEGYEITTAEDGKRGLDMALSTHPDLIILDVMMPSLNGWEVLEALRADEWGSGARVIMLTNSDDMENVSKAVSHQAQEYLIKGTWTLDDIAAKVRGLLG